MVLMNKGIGVNFTGLRWHFTFLWKDGKFRIPHKTGIFNRWWAAFRALKLNINNYLAKVCSSEN